MHAAREACLAHVGGFSRDFSVERVAASIDKGDRKQGYQHVPADVLDAWSLILEQKGKSALEHFLRLLVIFYIERACDRFGDAGLPRDLEPEFHAVFLRILQSILDDSFDADPLSHVFLKDLAIARMQLIPCVSHVVYRYSGIPRRSLLAQPLVRSPEIVSFLGRAGGFKPYLENHVHPAMLNEFNEIGRERCLRLVAELLQAWPESRGLVGASWYYDPEVSKISPHLAYLHDIPAQNGALILGLTKEGADSGALVRSATRRRMFEAGQYTPVTHMMVWARADLLRYAS